MNYIDPEDLEWSDNFHNKNFNNEIFVNKFCGLMKDDQKNQLAITQTLKKEKVECINSVDVAEEKCYTALGESELKFSNITSVEELKSFTRNYSGDALNCLYRSEEQSIDLGNVIEQDTGRNHIISEEESLCFNESSALITNSSETFKTNCFPDKTLLNAETISLIRNSISGVYDPPESFSSIASNENQVVPISDYITLDENEKPLASLSFPNQTEPNKENILENNETSNSPKISGFNLFTNKNEASDGELGIQSLFEEISVYTPGGQCYKLTKNNNLCSKPKVSMNKNQLEVAVLLNNCKKARQIQCGIFIPETIDYNKEEDFNDWLREEKYKTKSLFENFNIKLNVKYLTTERELIKLDRYLKQYATSDFLDPLEILEIIEKTDVDITNLVFTHQVYETVSKITKNCKGRLRLKSRAVLMKLKVLLSPSKGIKAEKYLNDLLNKNNVSKLKPEAPVEWIVHLLTFINNVTKI